MVARSFDPDPTTLAVVRELFERHRAAGLSEAEVRSKIIDELRDAFPAEAFDAEDMEATVARWERAVDLAAGQLRR